MGTGSRGGMKLPGKTLQPEGRKYKMQPREPALSEKGRTRNSSLVFANPAARWGSSGEKGCQDQILMMV